MAYYFLFTTASGQILAANTTGFTPGTGEAVLGPLSSADTNAVVAYQYPQRFLVRGSPPALVPQPWWNVQVIPASTAGQYTITATLENPPSTPPSTATLTIAGGTLSGTVSSNQVSWTVTLHPSVATQGIPLQVSASGTVAGTATINSGTPSIGLQLIPASGTTPPTVAPSGAGSLAYLRQQAMGLTMENLLDLTTLNSQNLAIAVSVGLRTLVEKFVPWAQQSTWSPLSLTTAEQNGLNILSTELIPYLLGASDLLDSQNNPIPPVAEAIAQAPLVQKALTTYAQWAASLPNLQ